MLCPTAGYLPRPRPDHLQAERPSSKQQELGSDTAIVSNQATTAAHLHLRICAANGARHGRAPLGELELAAFVRDWEPIDAVGGA